MDYVIREIKSNEIPLLADFLYEAIFIPDWYTDELPKSIIYDDPQIYASINEFGTLPDDFCLVASTDDKIVGAVWARITDEYGHIDNKTPSLAISLYKEYRRKGIGSELMINMLNLLKQKGYQQVSLGVNKENYAVKFYEKLGFKIIGDGANETEYLMIYKLN